MSEERILIIDPRPARPYCHSTLEHEALTGLKATVVRVAAGLRRRHQVTVAQSGLRQAFTDRDGVDYEPYRHNERAARHDDVDTVIVINSPKILKRIRARFPRARLFFWLHAYPTKRLRTLAQTLVSTDTQLIAISHHHADELRRFLVATDEQAGSLVRIHWIYSPIDDGLVPDATPVIPTKLFFPLAAHKGQGQVLAAFAALREAMPDLELYLANQHSRETLPPGVINLGRMPHATMIRHLRESFCLFYPQWSFPEPFGLIFAEANAVGTPVVAHDFGAAKEVVAGSKEQLVDARRTTEITELLTRWREFGRPQVFAEERFRLSAVLDKWEAILFGTVPLKVEGPSANGFSYCRRKSA